ADHPANPSPAKCARSAPLLHHSRPSLPLGILSPGTQGGGYRNRLRLTFPLDPGPILLCGLFGLILSVVVVDPILQRVGEVLLLHIVIGIIMGIAVLQAMA